MLSVCVVRVGVKWRLEVLVMHVGRNTGKERAHGMVPGLWENRMLLTFLWCRKVDRQGTI